jgi:hypothetical protein
MLSARNILLLIIIAFVASFSYAGSVPPASKHVKAQRNDMIDGQEFVSVEEIARSMKSAVVRESGACLIKSGNGHIVIMPGSLFVALERAGDCSIAQMNHPAVLRGNVLLVPKKSCLEAISQVGHFEKVEFEEKSEESTNGEIHEMDEEKPAKNRYHDELIDEGYTNPALGDIDRSTGNARALEPAMEKAELNQLNDKIDRSSKDLDAIIKDVDELKKKSTNYTEDGSQGGSDEKALDEVIESGTPERSHFRTDDKNDNIDNAGGDDRSARIAPAVDDIKSLFQRGMKVIGNIKLESPSAEEEHTTAPNPHLIDEEPAKEPAQEPAPAQIEVNKPKSIDTPVPPNVYTLPKNLIRRQIKK